LHSSQLGGWDFHFPYCHCGGAQRAFFHEKAHGLPGSRGEQKRQCGIAQRCGNPVEKWWNKGNLCTSRSFERALPSTLWVPCRKCSKMNVGFTGCEKNGPEGDGGFNPHILIRPLNSVEVSHPFRKKRGKDGARGQYLWAESIKPAEPIWPSGPGLNRLRKKGK